MTACLSRTRLSIVAAVAAAAVLALGAGAPVASASATKCSTKLWDLGGIPWPVPIANVCLNVVGSGLVVNQMNVTWNGLQPERRICNSRAVVTVNPPIGAGPTSVSRTPMISGCRYIAVNFGFAANAYFPSYGYLPNSFPHGSVVSGRIEESDDNGRTWRTYKSAGGITINR
jgi:hypothetical protein